MKTVKIVSGTYGYKPKGKTGIKPVSVGGIVTVNEEEAERLVSLGVAVILDDNTDGTAKSQVEISNDPNNQPEERNDSTRHLDADLLATMTNAELKKLAEDMGIDTKKIRAKAGFVAAITAVDMETHENRVKPPVIGAEAPVV